MHCLLSSAPIIAVLPGALNHPLQLSQNHLVRAWLSTNGQTFFKRRDPEKVSIVKAWSFQTIRFIRTVSPSASARPPMALLLRRCCQSQKGTAGCWKKNSMQTKLRFRWHENRCRQRAMGVVSELLLTLVIWATGMWSSGRR